MITIPSAEILLVEDSAQDLELTLRALAKTKLTGHVVVARDGAEALDFVFGQESQAETVVCHSPSLVLLDLKLPKVDGLEVLQRLKADKRTRAIPVVVLTSSREQCDVLESYRLGVNSYVVKPVDSEAFSAAVREIGQYWLLRNEPPVCDSN